MKVIICDDSEGDLRNIQNLLIQYQRANPRNAFEVKTCSDSAVLYRKITEGKTADLYILDMLMPKRTGIDLGRQIRNCGCEAGIIYLTSSDDYALDAYRVYAIRYLLKPIEKDKFFEALDYARFLFKQKPVTETMYLVKTKEGLAQTPYSKIEYIENVNRKLEIHLVDGGVLKSIFIRRSFEEEVKELSEERNFLQVHKSFLVNLDHVRNLDTGIMIMECGGQIPVSKARAAEVKREYLLFVSGKY